MARVGEDELRREIELVVAELHKETELAVQTAVAALGIRQPDDRWMSSAEASVYTGDSPATLRRAEEAGELRGGGGHGRGHKRSYLRSDLDRYKFGLPPLPPLVMLLLVVVAIFGSVCAACWVGVGPARGVMRRLHCPFMTQMPSSSLGGSRSMKNPNLNRLHEGPRLITTRASATSTRKTKKPTTATVMIVASLVSQVTPSRARSGGSARGTFGSEVAVEVAADAVDGRGRGPPEAVAA